MRTKAVGRLTSPELTTNDRSFQVGDDVICLHNDRRLGVLNGTRGTVTSVDVAQRTLTLSAMGGTSITVPAAYLDAGHMMHGYAITGLTPTLALPPRPPSCVTSTRRCSRSATSGTSAQPRLEASLANIAPTRDDDWQEVVNPAHCSAARRPPFKTGDSARQPPRSSLVRGMDPCISLTTIAGSGALIHTGSADAMKPRPERRTTAAPT